jgi:hypothetical protein
MNRLRREVVVVLFSGKAFLFGGSDDSAVAQQDRCRIMEKARDA